MPDSTIHRSIDKVLSEMDDLINLSIRKKSKLGYFTVLYRNVTAEVKRKIEVGFFDDNERMEKLVVVFASRYLDAVRQYNCGEKPSKCWRFAFNESKKDSRIIVQHLLLGMNAHINLDLGIATATVAPGSSLPQIKNDFNKIMDILSNMIDKVQDRLGTVSPAFRLIDEYGCRMDETIAGFSVKKARDYAWNSAKLLAKVPPEDAKKIISGIDEFALVLARTLVNPGIAMTVCFDLIGKTENKNVGHVIESLRLKEEV